MTIFVSPRHGASSRANGTRVVGGVTGGVVGGVFGHLPVVLAHEQSVDHRQSGRFVAAREEVAADEISRERNRELARFAAEAEAELPDFNATNSDLPSGF